MKQQLLEVAQNDKLGVSGFDSESLKKLLDEPESPDEFGAFDESIETEHRCPSCGYEWSGKQA